MDVNGDISLAYSVSSGSVYPGIRYTGRMAGDPLGTMTFAEQTAVSGSASGSASWTQYNRWGDYSNTTLDPTDGGTFWHCDEYVGPAANQNTRIFSFKLDPTLGLPETQQAKATLKIFQSGEQLNVQASQLPSNDKVLLDMFAINGKQLNSQSLMPIANTIETQININRLAAGMYFVRIGNADFQVIQKVEVIK
jgi:hypothetical protein